MNSSTGTLCSCVWLYSVSEYCTFTSIVTLSQVCKTFQSLLVEQATAGHLKRIYHQQRDRILVSIELSPACTQFCFRENVWTEKGIVREGVVANNPGTWISLNQLLDLATASCQSCTDDYSVILRNSFAGSLTPLQFIVKLIEIVLPEICTEKVTVSQEQKDYAREKVIDILISWAEHDLVNDFMVHHPFTYKHLICNTVQPLFVYLESFHHSDGKDLRNRLVSCWQRGSVSHRRRYNLTDCNRNLLEYSVEEIAKVLTIADAVYFSRISSSELSEGGCYTLRDLRAPNIQQMYISFMKTRDWVTSSIYNAKDSEIRRKCVEKFVRVAMELFRNNNFNSFHSVIYGIHSAAVDNLVKDSMDSDLATEYEKVFSFTESERKFGKMLRRMQRQGVNYLPFLGRIASYSIFNQSDDSNGSNQNHHLLSLEKLRTLSQAIEKEFKPYRFHDILRSKQADIDRAMSLFQINIFAPEFNQ